MSSLLPLIKRLIFTGLLATICTFSSAQPDVYFFSAAFASPGASPFVETYMTIVGKSLASIPKEKKFMSSVLVNVRIYKDSALVKVNKYNLRGPVFDSLNKSPSFVDVQRYSLPEGKYNLELEVSDNYSPGSKSLLIKDNIIVSFPENKLSFSTIQPLESFAKADAASTLSKSGMNMVPYTVNYYPESSNILSFYLEAYNIDKVISKAKPFVYAWYVESENGKTKFEAFGGFKKESASSVNPLLTRMDISKLGTGNYNLVIEVRDHENKLLGDQKYFFQRVNRNAEAATTKEISDKIALRQYFGNVNHPDTLKMFVECLWPIANGVDKERLINQSLKKDPQLMKNFVIDFWERRAADTANPLKMWAAYYKNVQKVMVMFKCGKQPGYYSERGRVFLQYGAPNQRSEQPNEPNTFPYEIWQYYRLTDGVNGQFFSNRKFVFVNKNLGDDCHTLVHSDLRGEIYNPRWQYEVTRRNTNGLSNPDNNTPGGTQHNQFNEIFSNPR